MYRAAQGSSVLWLSYNGLGYTIIKKVAGSGNIERQTFDRDFKSTLFFDVFSSTHFDIVCLDGAIPELKDVIACVYTKYPQVHIVVCTSFPSFTPNAQYVSRIGLPVRYTMDSWSMEEYDAAWTHGIFGPITREVFNSRFYYAGGNMRNFKRGSKHAQKIFQMTADQCVDPLSILQSGSLLSSNSVINSLVSLHSWGQRQLVSRFVLDLLSAKCSLQLVTLARNNIPCKYPANNRYLG
jgi:hypothetical protein